MTFVVQVLFIESDELDAVAYIVKTFGPFPSEQDAERWGRCTVRGDKWTVVQVLEPY